MLRAKLTVNANFIAHALHLQGRFKRRSYLEIVWKEKLLFFFVQMLEALKGKTAHEIYDELNNKNQKVVGVLRAGNLQMDEKKQTHGQWNWREMEWFVFFYLYESH